MMSVDYKRQIQRLESRYRMLLGARHLLLSLLFLSFCIMVFSGCRLFVDIGFDLSFKIAMGVACAAGLVFSMGTKKSFQHLLIFADQRLGLQDQLSTAHECFQNRARGAFVQMLFNAAGETIHSLGVKKILPFEWPRVFYCIPLFIFISLVFYGYGSIRDNPAQTAPLETEIASVLAQIETLKKELSQTHDTQNNEKRFRQMEKSAKAILDSGMQSKRAAVKSFTGLLKVLEQRNEEAVNTLKEKLNLNDRARDKTGGMNIPAPIPGQAKKQGRQKVEMDLEELKEKIEQAFDEDVPEHLSKQVKDIETSVQFQEYLEQLLQKHKNANEDVGDEEEWTGNSQDGQNGQDAATRDDARDDGTEGAGTGNPDSNQEGFKAGTKTPEHRPRKETRLEPGKGRIERDVPEKDNAEGFKKGAYQYAVKALSTIGESTLTEDEIQKKYIRQNEAVLLKESIPAEYRESIRDYFLSIGLERE